MHRLYVDFAFLKSQKKIFNTHCDLPPFFSGGGGFYLSEGPFSLFLEQKPIVAKVNVPDPSDFYTYSDPYNPYFTDPDPPQISAILINKNFLCITLPST